MIKRRENLADMTVKALNALAKDMKLRGYSKLRKAALVEFIATELDRQDAEAENRADHDTIAALIAEVAVEAEREVIDARSLNLVTGGSDSERSDTYGINMRPVQIAPEAVFSSAPTATPSEAQNVAQDEAEAPSLDDLKFAYRNLRATVNKMGARGNEGQRRIRYVGRLRSLSAQLASYGVKAAFL